MTFVCEDSFCDVLFLLFFLNVNVYFRRVLLCFVTTQYNIAMEILAMKCTFDRKRATRATGWLISHHDRENTRARSVHLPCELSVAFPMSGLLARALEAPHEAVGVVPNSALHPG